MSAQPPQDWRYPVISGLGGKPTPSTLAFLNGWQRKEGGHTNNTARFNWLNRTGSGGYPTMNSVGVEVYPDYRTGVSRTVDLIKEGYPSIHRSLQSGQVNYSDPTVQADLNRWLTGKRTPGMTPYVKRVMELSGGKPGPYAAQPGGAPAAPAGAPMVMAPQAPQAPQRPGLAQVMPLIAAIQAQGQQRRSGQRPSMAPLIGALMGIRQFQQQPTQQQTAPQTAPQAAPPVSAPQAPGQAPQAGGGWGGSQGIATGLASIAHNNGLKTISEKRDTKNTASGGVSDHWVGSKDSYAFDLSNGSKPTAEMDRAAQQLAAQYGFNYDGKSELVKNFYSNGYRIQILYRTNVGGNHFNHIHVGVRRES